MIKSGLAFPCSFAFRLWPGDASSSAASQRKTPTIKPFHAVESTETMTAASTTLAGYSTSNFDEPKPWSNYPSTIFGLLISFLVRM